MDDALPPPTGQPASAATPPPPRVRRRRRLALALGLGVVALLLLVVAAGGGLWWSTRSDVGTAWLLSRLPGVEVTRGRGTLWGDYAADRLAFALPGGGKVTLTGFGWRGLRVEHAAWASYRARVAMAELYAARVDLELPPDDATATREPPASLRLPLQLDVERLRIGELHAAALGERPLRDLSAALHLGAENGAQHRVERLALAWDRLAASGALRIGADAPFDLDASVALASQPGSDASPLPAVSARATLTGPLARPTLVADASARPSASRPEQSLAARAVLQPFAAFPLAELRASTRSLDLSAFHRGAPVTMLSGDAEVAATGLDQPATVSANLSNAEAGRWNEGRLPVRALTLELRARPNDPGTLDLRAVDAELGTRQQAGGRLRGSGRWTAARWSFDATLDGLQPALLDARAAAMLLSGPVSATGTVVPAPAAAASAPGAAAPASAAAGDRRVDLKAALNGRFTGAGPVRAAQVTLDASGSASGVEIRTLQAVAGGARASLVGSAARAAETAPWQARGRAALVDFDPVPWWPGRLDPALRRAPTRLNATAEFDLALPADLAGTPVADLIGALRGSAGLTLAESRFAGVPLSGSAALRASGNGAAAATLQLQAAGNRVKADGRIDTARRGAADRWDIEIAAPDLAPLTPLWRAVGGAPGDAVAGALSASARVDGRWPAIATQGRFAAEAVHAGPIGVQRSSGRWTFDSTRPDARVDAQLSANRLVLSRSPASAAVPPIESLQLQLAGTTRAHTLELQADSMALPPAWVDAMRATGAAPAAGTAGGANAGNASPPTAAASPAGPPAVPAPGVAANTRTPTAAPPPAPRPAPTPRATVVTPAASGVAPAPALVTPSPAARTLALLRLHGGASGTAAQPTGWRGSIDRIELRSTEADAAPWIAARDIGIDARWAGATRVEIAPGRAAVLGAGLRWGGIAWQAGAPGHAARIDAEAELEPLTVAPLLARIQPGFGWGGDLTVTGRLSVHSAPTFRADIVIERQKGDLTVTDEAATTQALGLTELRLGLAASDGVWSFTQGLAGSTLGVAAGAIVARTSPTATWPTPDAPLSGVLEVQVANLGTWGPWVPAGWRLTGALRTSASIGGRFGAPEYTGEIRGTGIGVRNFLEGVNVTDGDVLVTLQGETARIERFTARAGAGSISLDGGASLGAAPTARMSLRADRFQLLGRIDRRIVTSGQAQLRLDRQTLAVDGAFGVDEGLIDFTRSDAPQLSSDVVVLRGPRSAAPTAPAGSANPAPGRDVRLNLQVSLGERLRLRGRGLDAGLRGDLRITSPGSRLAVAGTVRAVDGTYAAYAQKLTIERGEITFLGPIENPRLYIEATRPDTDVRVGVQVTGTALNPRVRLFSEPEMSETDKLSWLMLGRAPEGLGGADTALLQRAAMALLSGEGEGATTRFTRAIGLDDLSLRQAGSGDLRDTVISLGKQISRRWYVGYERSLSATTGSWQLIYRVARRFTLRAQTGDDSALDAIWTWRWQ